MRAPLSAVIFLLFAPTLALAEAAPKPAPEIQKLGYYVGAWVGHGALDLCRAAQTGDDPGSRTVDDHRFSPSRKESVMRRLAVICTSVGN